MAMPRKAMDTKKNHLVTQANALIEASYKLNLEEKRLVIAAISKIDGRKELPDSISITADEYSRVFNIDVNSAYGQLKAAALSLYDRTIKIRTDKTVNDEMRWIYRRAVYKSGQVTIKFSPDLQPFLSHIHEKFKSYKLSNVSRLKSTYSIRLYELLNQYSDLGYRWFTVDDFRAIFKLEASYPRFSDVKKWVITPAIKEINSASNYDVTCNYEKSGRSVSKIWFNFRDKAQLSFPI